MKSEDIEILFTYHNPAGIDPNRFTEIREAAKVLAHKILEHGGKDADSARAIQKLRECVYYAIASIVLPDFEE